MSRTAPMPGALLLVLSLTSPAGAKDPPQNQAAQAWVVRGSQAFQRAKTDTAHRQALLQESLADYQTALRLQPDDCYALNNIGLLYAALQDYRQAIPYYDRAIAIAPEWPWPYMDRGNAYYQLGQVDQAKRDWQAVTDIEPGMADRLAQNRQNQQALARQTLQESFTPPVQPHQAAPAGATSHPALSNSSSYEYFNGHGWTKCVWVHGVGMCTDNNVQ